MKKQPCDSYGRGSGNKASEKESVEQGRKVAGQSSASVAGTNHVRTDFPGDVPHQSSSRLDHASDRSAGDLLVDASGLCQIQMDAGTVFGDAFGDGRLSVERMAVGLARGFSAD